MERARYLWRLYQKAFGAYTWQILLIILLAFISSAAEGLGISTIIPIFGFVGASPGSATDTISRIIQSLFGFFHILFSFRMLLIFIAALFVLRILLVLAIQYVTAHIVYNYERDLRTKLFSQTLAARWPYLSQQRIGNLEQLLTTNTSNASQFFGNISTSAMVGTKVIMYLVLAVNISWWIAALALLGGVVMGILLRPVFWRNRQVSTEVERTNRELAHFVSEHVIGIKAVKAMALEAPVLSRGSGLFERMRQLNTRSVVLRGYTQAFIQFAGVVFVGIIFVIMYRSPGFSIASFAVIVYAISQIFAQIQSGQVQLHGVTTLLPYIAETLRYSDRTYEEAEERGGPNTFSLQKNIELRDVSFAYPDREPVLRGAEVSIRQGELLGVVGPSGAGKSTLADLLLRLIEPTQGVILADGQDVRHIPVASWRMHVGYVPQDAVLLNDTVEENIRFYNPKLTHDDVVAAAKLANIHEFIETLPRGYKEFIGERGVMLSGGQKQRVALARVLSRKPSLLVLDEATSALDGESERAIQEAIEGLRGTTTIVIIAHRLSTIRTADRILEIKNGTVHEADRAEVLKSEV